MKKNLLLFVLLISIGFSAKSLANNNHSVNINSYGYYNNHGEKFTFVEDGITFSVFKNGEFDFYINPRSGLYANIDLNAVSISYNSGYDYNAYVQYDDYGAIVQIENVPIYYDHYGRVIRAGGIRINYYNHRLVRIGGLRVYYNPYGYYSHYSGYINSYNRYYSYYPYNSYFIRPYYNNCIVSYNPYRYYYKPVRYKYYSNRNYHHNNYYKNNRKSKGFRNVDSRIRIADSNTSYQKRSANDSRVAGTSTSTRSQKTKLSNNRSHNIRSNGSVKNQGINQKVRTQSNRSLQTGNRVSQSIKKERLATSQRRNVASINTKIKRASNSEIGHRSSVNNTRTKNDPKKRIAKGVSSKKRNQKLTKSKASIRKKSNSTVSKRTDVPSRNRRKSS